MTRFVRLRVGAIVQVRTAREILSTLEDSGTLDGLPFMREMLPFCGKRFRVSGVAHKTCDTVRKTGGRRMRNAVHLEDLRCDGGDHGGCEAGCLIFWKADWLTPVAASTDVDAGDAARGGDAQDSVATGRLDSRISIAGEATRYTCQATQLYEATEPLSSWDVRQYWADINSGNAKLGEALTTLFLAAVEQLRSLRLGYRVWNAIYDFLHRAIRQTPSPYGTGRVPSGIATPTDHLNLRAGDWVQVKSLDEILNTLNERNFNRGMRFDVEMAPYCGQRHRVSRRVSRIIDERTGGMLEFGTPSVVLDNVVCRSMYSSGRLLCPRRIPSYWREIWLRRMPSTRDSPEAAGPVPCKQIRP